MTISGGVALVVWLCTSAMVHSEECTYSNCQDCSQNSSCLWCQTHNDYQGGCANYWNASVEPCKEIGWCGGKACTCSIYPSTNSLGSMIIMILFYGFLLAFGAKTIADGSEILLELFPDWGTVIGALLLPVVGTMPDCAMIFVSGALGTLEEAQKLVSVGVGTLAGSTIMLLTVPWSACLIVARTDIVEGKARDGRLTKGLWEGLLSTGVTVDRDTMRNARISIGVSLSFLVVQIVVFWNMRDPNGSSGKNEEKYATLAGFILCIILFIAYCSYQLMVPKLVEKRKEKAEQNASERKIKFQASLIIEKMRKSGGGSTRGQPIDNKELENPKENSELYTITTGITRRRKKSQGEKEPLLPSNDAHSDTEQEIENDIEVDNYTFSSSLVKEEEPFAKTLSKSIALLLFGTFLIAAFSDPMVDVIAELGLFIHVPSFYISFVITPFCSNASETISGLIFATKKTKKTTSMTFSQLYGAVAMNNTMGLAIFYGIVFFRGLSWDFSAETISILVVVLVVCLVASFKKTFPLIWIFPNMMLYPLSLFMVYALQTYIAWP